MNKFLAVCIFFVLGATHANAMYTSFHNNLGMLCTYYQPNVVGCTMAVASHFVADALNEDGDYTQAQFATIEGTLISIQISTAMNVEKVDVGWMVAGVVCGNLPDIVYRLGGQHFIGIGNINLTREQTIALDVLLTVLTIALINSSERAPTMETNLENYKLENFLGESQWSYSPAKVNELWVAR